jgi:hypothetical protein
MTSGAGSSKYVPCHVQGSATEGPSLVARSLSRTINFVKLYFPHINIKCLLVIHIMQMVGGSAVEEIEPAAAHSVIVLAVFQAS